MMESLRVNKMGNTYIRNFLSQCIYTLSQPQDPKSQAYMVARLLCFTTPTDATCMFKRKKNHHSHLSSIIPYLLHYLAKCTGSPKDVKLPYTVFKVVYRSYCLSLFQYYMTRQIHICVEKIWTLAEYYLTLLSLTTSCYQGDI